ncbi:MAG: NINE protein [Candidatus Latescibacteria bacterium]|nr:NINE protein [Candidatus Latescibacterota bacterium]
MDNQQISPRSRLVAAVLCSIGGVFGAHRFYVGKIGTALLMIVTVGGLGIWSFIDLIIILVGSFRDDEGRLVHEWLETAPRTVRKVTKTAEVDSRIDRIDRQLTDLQGAMIDLSEKFDRHQFGVVS